MFFFFEKANLSQSLFSAFALRYLIFDLQRMLLMQGIKIFASTQSTHLADL